MQWNASNVGLEDIKVHFSNLVEYVNCPKSIHSKYLEGDTELEILQNLLAQFQDVDMHTHNMLLATKYLEKMPEDVIQYIELTGKFFESFAGKFFPASTDRGDFEDIFARIKENMFARNSSVATLAMKLFRILQEAESQEGENYGNVFLHGLWLNFFHALIQPVILGQSYVGEESEDTSTYLYSMK